MKILKLKNSITEVKATRGDQQKSQDGKRISELILEKKK